ncbi:MAG: ParB/RepB/Spo0J family partition protein, partial [Gemmatimonadales bacterium]|nr:ParB/RepB/Spo0J family partition protein [Gemmatimonadales bacterium]
ALARPRKKGGGYELAAGHRRYRAAKLAGLTLLKTEVREMDDPEFVEALNVSNLQRDDLNALEEAEGFVTLMKVCGLKIPGIAARVGKSIKYVYDRIKLLQLIPEAKELLLQKAFEPGHAILLARIAPAEQKRAIANPRNQFGSGGLFQEDRSDGELALETGPAKLKAVSVREFETWLKRHVRFDPTKEDVSTLFPETAKLLADAEAEKRRHVFITYDHRVADDAKDRRGERTFGKESWKRADGLKGSKECERSVVGIVAAGRGRGEAFLVCVSRDRCEVHYGPQVRARLQREAARATGESAARDTASKASAATKPPKVDPFAPTPEVREAWLTDWCTDFVSTVALPAVKRLITEVKLSDEIAWNLAGADFYLGNWSAVGKHAGYREGLDQDLEERLDPLLVEGLPGKWGASTSDSFSNGAAARAFLALRVWVARDGGPTQAAHDKYMEEQDKKYRKDIAATQAAEKKAAPRAPAQRPAKGAKKGKAATGSVTIKKTGKRAGDVDRAKAKKKAKKR